MRVLNKLGFLRSQKYIYSCCNIQQIYLLKMDTAEDDAELPSGEQMDESAVEDLVFQREAIIEDIHAKVMYSLIA